MPAFVAGRFYVYEDLLGAFSAQVVARPSPGGPPLNTIAITSHRIIAFDTHGATELAVALPYCAVTGVSTPEDARQGRVVCVTSDQRLDIAELAPVDAAFVQEILYHGAAGRLYRLGPPPE